MELRTLSKQISYLPATTQPLSADVGLIRGDRFDWIFDVGSNAETMETIQQGDKEKNIVLSHFHADHIRNLEQIRYCNLYCGDYTRGKLGKGTEVNSPITYEDGVKLTLFPIPSPHSKGAVGLEVNEEYAFLGDAVYGAEKNGKAAYNINMLKELIAALEQVKAQLFLISHQTAFVQPKAKIMTALMELYAMRKPGEAYLILDNHGAW